MVPHVTAVPPHRPGGPSRIIQGFFPGGRPRLPQAAAASPRWPVPVSARAGTPTGGPRPILPNASRPVAVQPSGGHAFAVPPAFQLRPFGLGQRLPEAVQRKMEAFFGAGFDDVRVHVGGQAASIGALAFTIGSDLYFAPGQYNPQTMQGQQLLGHELTHVVQQRAGRVKNPMGGGLAVVQDPHLEAEAERMGMRAASSSVPIQAKAAGTSPAGPRPVVAPILPGAAAAAQPVRPAVIGPAPILPRPAGGLSPLQARSAGAPETAPVQVAPPAKVGPNTYRIAAGAGGRPIGSVLVHARGASAIEVTDLSVEPSYRGQGLGGILLASAMRAGQQLGRSRAVLASQDDGSGRLTRWYRRMGFEPAGVNGRGYQELEGSIGRILAGVAQARMAPTMGGRPAGASTTRPTPRPPRGGPSPGPVPPTPGRPHREAPAAIPLLPGRPAGAIQRMRSMMEQKHNFILLEQGEYKKHVYNRIRHCVNMYLRVWIYHAWASGGAYSGQLRRAQSTISSKAEVQVGSGDYSGNYSTSGLKVDAAHLMNTSIRDDVLAQGQNLDAKRLGVLKELKEASGATTMQTKANNVGPDKKIDTCMSTFAADCTKEMDKGTAVPKAEDLLKLLSGSCLAALKKSKKATKDQGYIEAIAGCQVAADNAAGDGYSIDIDVAKWAIESEFV